MLDPLLDQPAMGLPLMQGLQQQFGKPHRMDGVLPPGLQRGHQIALVVNGIFLLENMKLEELAAKKAYEFAFVVQPLKVKGGTGSTVAPVAIR